MSFEGLLDSTCKIMQETLGAADGIGGYAASSWGVLYPRVACRFESLPKMEEILGYDKKTTYPDYYLYLVYRSGIKEGMRIYYKGRQFEIKLDENWSEQDKYQQLSLTELARQ
ncbi:unnamed protein product [marine sediment metagenome]|uniref:Uncharacterized protein n=1 Tax=marine sediment metagenome TaxID=412755 RepID=X1F1D9_9ZZZZ